MNKNGKYSENEPLMSTENQESMYALYCKYVRQKATILK